MNRQEKQAAQCVMPLTEPFIDKAEVGRRLQLRPRTIDTAMKKGRICYYNVGGAVRFKWSEIEAHLARTCRVGGTSASDGASTGD